MKHSSIKEKGTEKGEKVWSFTIPPSDIPPTPPPGGGRREGEREQRGGGGGQADQGPQGGQLAVGLYTLRTSPRLPFSFLSS